MGGGTYFGGRPQYLQNGPDPETEVSSADAEAAPEELEEEPEQQQQQQPHDEKQEEPQVWFFADVESPRSRMVIEILTDGFMLNWAA